jgi:hypothetical protein
MSNPEGASTQTSMARSETGVFRQKIASKWAEEKKDAGAKYEFQKRFEATTGHVSTLWNVFRVSIPHDWGAINNSHVLALVLTWVLDLVICTVVAVIMAALLYAYTLIPWQEDLTFYFTFAVILPFPILWNVAQYASFTIQLAGHQTIMGHVRSLRLFGPVLVGTVGLAVALCVLCDQLEAINDDNRVNMTVVIATGPILIGLWCKTALKMQYIREKYMNPEVMADASSLRRGALVDNVARKPELLISAYNQDGALKSEFGAYSAGQTSVRREWSIGRSRRLLLCVVRV